ncbi:hypothetical protein ACRAWG_18955 [Methylobacterium sp. P31]
MEPSVEFGLDLVPPPWLLGCGRSGGAAAAAAFGHRMRAHDALPPGRGRVRALPMVVPAFGRAEAERIAEGDRTSRSLVASVALLAALRAAASDRHADAVDPVAYAAALGVDAEQARAPDEREAGDRLREPRRRASRASVTRSSPRRRTCATPRGWSAGGSRADP